MKVFSVIGISKSGKTTTIENIIKELRKRNYSVGSVKEIHFENDRYYQFWHFDSKEEADKAFTAVWKEINDCILSGRNCLLDEAIIKARVRAGLNQNEEIK